MTFAQRRNRLTTHFSERIPVVMHVLYSQDKLLHVSMPTITTIIRVDNTTAQKIPLFDGVCLVMRTPHISRASCVMVFNLASSLCLLKSTDHDQILFKATLCSLLSLPTSQVKISPSEASYEVALSYCQHSP